MISKNPSIKYTTLILEFLNIDNREHYEFEKVIKGTKISTKVKIYKIINIDRDFSFEELEKFELLAEANDWSNQTMGKILYDLIEDENI